MIDCCEEEMRGRVGMRMGFLSVSVGRTVVVVTVGARVTIIVGFTLTVGFTFIVELTLTTKLIPLLGMG